MSLSGNRVMVEPLGGWKMWSGILNGRSLGMGEGTPPNLHVPVARSYPPIIAIESQPFPLPRTLERPL